MTEQTTPPKWQPKWHYAIMDSDSEANQLLAALTEVDQLPPPPRPKPVYTAEVKPSPTTIEETRAAVAGIGQKTLAWIQESLPDPETDDSSSEFAGAMTHTRRMNSDYDNSVSSLVKVCSERELAAMERPVVEYLDYTPPSQANLPPKILAALREFRTARRELGATHCIPCFRTIYNPKSTNPLVQVGDVRLPHPFFFDGDSKWATAAHPAVLAKKKTPVIYGLLYNRTEWFINRPEGTRTTAPIEILALVEAGSSAGTAK